MKRILLFLTLLLLPSVASFATDGVSTVPALFFSDLTSGPKTGGKGNNGVFVSVYGKNFGASRGSSTITVGGGEVSSYDVWLDTYAAFQLGTNAATGNIVLTTSAGASNGLAFTVRAGNIYFVDISTPTAGDGSYGNHWKSPASYYNACVAGDTCYFRTGTYSEEYGKASWHANVCIDSSKSGTSGNDIAWVGYPGEVATFSANSGSDPTMSFRNSSASYIVIANIYCDSYRDSIVAGDYWRVVGNICSGNHAHSSEGIIHSGGLSCKIYGNEVTGGASSDKTDHAIYLEQSSNIDVGWNYLYDNDFDEGPLIMANSDVAQENNLTFSNYKIHDNIIDMSIHPSRAIGIIEVGNASTFYIYNNIIIGESYVSNAPTLYAQFGNVYYYNNTIYNCGNATAGNSIFWMDAGVTSSEYKNNIVYSSSTCVSYMIIDGGSVVNTNNCWYGIGSFASKSTGSTGTNAGAVEDDPLFTTNGSDFHLQTGSPCRDVGANIVGYTTSFGGEPRPQGDISDMGAYEYYTGETGSITNKILNGGTWRGGSF